MRLNNHYISIFFIYLCGFNALQAQKLQHPSPFEIAQAPEWAKEMYHDNPNLLKIIRLKKEYDTKHPFKKSIHTQYFKRWSRLVRPYMKEDGFISMPNPHQIRTQQNTFENKLALNKRHLRSDTAHWQSLGPFQVYEGNGIQKKGEQTNIYSLARSRSNPLVLYCGTEPGELYKSTDGAESWHCVSTDYAYLGNSAIAIDPINENIVYSGGGNLVNMTTDGGRTWTTIMDISGLGTNEILIHPFDANLIYICAAKGLYQSRDGGKSWNTTFTESCYDIKVNTANPAILYLLKKNQQENICEFFISQDGGTSWKISNNGWYHSDDPNRYCEGGRIGVTHADPNRVYAYLIGDSKAGDSGFIGLFRSDDGGQNWILPNGPVGGPYSTDHPNTTTFDNGVNETYHQGFYNCALMVSNTDPNNVLIGGLNLWRSFDGGATMEPWAGYFGGKISIHVDMQDFRAFGDDYYITTDGGIYFSKDFFFSQPDVKMYGVRGQDYWGFGHAWNDKVFVGGLYHNGNLAYHENYGDGIAKSLGGGEAPTGYSNPGIDTIVYTSDVGGVRISNELLGNLQYFGIGMQPNESYFPAESSEIQFHPKNYNICYLGRDGKIWKSTNGAISFNELYTIPQEKYFTQDIEISFDDPNCMFANFRSGNGQNSILLKSKDGGETWDEIQIPPSTGNKTISTLAIDISNKDIVYFAYTYAGSHPKIFKSIDGGSSWYDISGTLLGDENIHEIVSVPFTNGGIYCFTNNTVYYRDDSMTDWIIFNQGLPKYMPCVGAKPFFKENKIVVASYGKGVWESQFHTNPSLPFANITVDNWKGNDNCKIDGFRFVSTSIIDQSGEIKWEFPGGIPESSNEIAQVVQYSKPGAYSAYLTVANSQGNISKDSMQVIIEHYNPPLTVVETFESNFPPENWESKIENGGLGWSKSSVTGAYGLSESSMIADNFDYDALGHYGDMRFDVNLDSTKSAILQFDRAYVKYDDNYADTLAILVSTDCGASFTELYRKGGNDLATGPDQQSYFIPNDDQWTQDSIDLKEYINIEKVIVAFRNIGKFGNVIYVDNINLKTQRDTSTVGLSITTGNYYFELTPNPVNNNIPISINTNHDMPFTLEVLDASGKQIFWQANMNQHDTLSANTWSSGTYYYRVYFDDYLKTGKFVVIGR